MNQRDAFFKQLTRLSIQDEKICVVTADMSAPGLDIFRRRFPSRYINTGIAEQSAILTACGLAKEGMKPFVYGIMPFVSLRPYEQIKVVAALMNININIVGIGSGFSYSDSGPTHHAIEDFAIMRILPNMEIWNCADNTTADRAALLSPYHDGPSYIRLDRKETANLPGDLDAALGFRVHAKDDKQYIITTGYPTHIAINSRKDTSADCGIIEIFKFPFDIPALLHHVNHKRILCIEENRPYGALYSILAEQGIPSTQFALADQYRYEYGDRDQLLANHGISKESIIQWTSSL